MRGKEPTVARRCLDLAPQLAHDVAPENLRLEDIAQRSGIPVDKIREVFQTAEGYLTAVQQDMFNERANALLVGVAELPPSLDRLRTLLTVYLDYAIRHATQYQWIVRAQGLYPHVAAEIRRRAETMDALLETDLHAMRWAHPLDCGHLVGALIREIARRETEKGAVSPSMRSGLWACLEAMGHVK